MQFGYTKELMDKHCVRQNPLRNFDTRTAETLHYHAYFLILELMLNLKHEAFRRRKILQLKM